MLRDLLLTALTAALLTHAAPAQQGGGQPPGESAPGDGIELNVQATPLGDVLEAISVKTGVNIVANVDTAVPVTANFYDATLEQALDWVLTPVGLAWYFDGQVYMVLPAADVDLIARPLVHHFFRPNYVSVAELEKFLTQFLSPMGRIVKSDAPEGGIPSGGDEAGGFNSTMPETLIVIDNEDAINMMIELAGELDTPPRQVQVEATIIEVVLDETNKWGIDFSFLGGHGFDEFESLLGAQSIYSAPTLAAPGQPIGGLTSPISGAPFLAPSGTSSATTSGFTTPGSAGLHFGYIGENLAAFVEALQTVADTNVLANTKVLTLNKMRGEIIIGGRLGYFGGTTLSDGISQQTVEFLEVGTQLRFRPYIGNDGMVRLEIHPQRSNGVVDPNTGLPSETTSEVTTNVMVRDGETIVIGGLIETSDVITTKRVPFLGYLPLIGWFFTSEESKIKRTEIVVLITPRVYQNGTMPTGGQDALDDKVAARAQMRENAGPVARVRQADIWLQEARAAMELGHLSEARVLCDRSLLLDPLADGALDLSDEIDARIAENASGGMSTEVVDTGNAGDSGG